MTMPMAAETPHTRPSGDEPLITLPTLRLIWAIVIACAAGAGLWAVGAMVLGYGPTVAGTGAIGSALALVFSVGAVLLLMPWIARPASTGLLLWLGADLLAMLLTIAAAYLLYSATFLASHPHLLGVVLTYFIVLPAKVMVIASHMRRHYY